MPRGVVPRQPAKTGRHEGARTIARGLRKQKGADGVSARDLGKYRQGSKRPGNVQAAPALKSKAGRTEKSKRYDPLAPERTRECTLYLGRAAYFRNAAEPQPELTRCLPAGSLRVLSSRSGSLFWQ